MPGGSWCAHHGPGAVVGGHGVRLVQPDGLIESVGAHQAPVDTQDRLDVVGHVVDVRRGDVEVPVVCAHGRVAPQRGEQPREVERPAVDIVPPVRRGGQVDHERGVDALDLHVCHLLQPREVVHGARPRVAAAARIPHVGLVPDDPVAHAAAIAPHESGHERAPQVARVVGGQVKTAGQPVRIHGPRGTAADDADDLAPRGNLTVDHGP